VVVSDGYRVVEGVLVSPQEESRRQGFCLLMGPRCGRVVSRLPPWVFQRGIGAGIVAARDCPVLVLYIFASHAATV